MKFGITMKAAAGLVPLMMFSGMSWASCPPIVPCKQTAEAQTIAGSNADQELITFAQDITTSTNEVAQALMDMANANAGAMNQSAQNIIATNAELSQIQLNQEMKIQKSMSDRKMAFDQQMTEATYRATTSVVSPDDTAEEFEFILDTLSNNSEMSVPEIVMMLRETMDKDDEDGKILVQIPASKGVCDDADVNEDGKCAIAKRIYPGRKLEALFKQCSVDKRMLKEKQKNNEARVAATEISNKKTSRALDVTNSSGAVASRLSRQLQLSCTPAQFKANLCGEGSPEDYQEDIVIGNIVPNGDVSAANFNSPAPSSAQGYIDDLSEQDRKGVEQQSLDRRPLQDDPNQRVIELKHTYRNANQVKAAMDFIDNLVADDLVPAVTPSDRRKMQNAEYQNRYLSRISALSMVRLALTESMSQRVGDKMREMILNDEFESEGKFEISAESPANKESVLGAGPLDVLQDRVDQQSANLQLGEQNGSSPNSGNDFVANPSKADSLEKITESILLQNEMLMKEYLMGEQTVALEAISLAQKANSKKMVELMKDLRRGIR